MGLGDMMKSVEAAKAAMAQMQSSMNELTAAGQSGGGMVKVVVNGAGYMQKIEIDDSLIKIDEKEILEDLIVAAVNDAKSAAEKLAQEKMKSLTAGLPLPKGLFG